MPIMHLKVFLLVVVTDKNPNSFMLHQLSNLAPYLSKLYHTTCFLVSLNISSPYTQACQNLLKCLPLHMDSKFELKDGICLFNLQTPDH